MIDLKIRPRRNRQNESIRRLVRETALTPSDLILPLFLIEGTGQRVPVKSMPGIFRLSRDEMVKTCKDIFALGIPAVALFPALSDSLKNSRATESTNANGLLQQTVRAIKDAVPGLLVITDVAMDPYSSDGHDGLVVDGKIVNDPTLEILAAMAVSQAKAGADLVAPSDMMDGRIGAIRKALDREGFTDTGILAYSSKFASSFYGPFREALDSAPRHGDKKTYQLDPANLREAVREAMLDEQEGADIVMIKPALPYLDVIVKVREAVSVPVAAYNVSGEYAMIKAAAQMGWLDEKAAAFESVLSIKRAGADMILTYFAEQLARDL